MADIADMSKGTKTLAISGQVDPDYKFIDVLDKEVEGFKLKYYMWLSRLFTLFAVISLLIFASSSLALFKLAPMVNVEPFLIINQDASEGIVRYEPIAYDMASKDQLMETFVKQYIIIRNTVIDDPIEMQSRWFPGGMLNFLSSASVFDQFDRVREQTFERMQEIHLVREVEIISIGKQGGAKSPIWKVDFKTYDLSEDANSPGRSNLRVRYWTASVIAYFFKERQFVGRRLINPLGFTVTRYSQNEVELF